MGEMGMIFAVGLVVAFFLGIIAVSYLQCTGRYSIYWKEIVVSPSRGFTAVSMKGVDNGKYVISNFEIKGASFVNRFVMLKKLLHENKIATIYIETTGIGEALYDDLKRDMGASRIIKRFDYISEGKARGKTA